MMKNLPSLGMFDVIVVGSGASGSPAAISAARQGARVLLLERLPFLGGNSTAVLDTFYGYYTPGTRSKRVIGGVPDEVQRRLDAYGMQLERPNTFGAGTAVTYHPEYLKVVWEQMAEDAGVNVLLNAWVQAVEGEPGKRIDSLVVATKAGLQRVEAKVFVDCSGDADLCAFGGFDYELAGEHEPAQTLTTSFKLVNVNIEKRKTINKDQLHALIGEASASGKYHLPMREGSDHITPVDHMTATVMTRLRSYLKREDGTVINATDPHLLSDAEIQGRRQVLEYVRFLRDRVPGYEKAQLSTFGMQIGVRETRRVYGEYRLNREDVLSARQFDDQIGLCGAPMEDHHEGANTKWAFLPDGECVGIPFRALIPRSAQNVLVAGRCFSSTHDAHASVRSMGQCMVMGQAAGHAAGLCAKRNAAPQELPIDELRNQLRAAGAVLETPA